MARLFDDGSSEYLIRAEVVHSATPMAMGCWFNTNDLSIHQCLMAISDEDAVSDYRSLQIVQTSGNLYVLDYRNGAGIAETTSGCSINNWHHACGIFASATDRRVLLDGDSKGTDNTNLTPINLDNTSIGIRVQSSNFWPMSGLIAEAVIWDLSTWPGATNTDKADNFEKILPSLAKGFSPLCYPLGLVAYWPLIRGLNDKIGGYNLTASGTVVSAHPRIILPQGVQ